MGALAVLFGRKAPTLTSPGAAKAVVLSVAVAAQPVGSLAPASQVFTCRLVGELPVTRKRTSIDAPAWRSRPATVVRETSRDSEPLTMRAMSTATLPSLAKKTRDRYSLPVETCL